jgi:hypothetical protein
MLIAPARATTPDSGTAIPANGTPAAAAYPTILLEKCPAPLIRNIAEYSSRPNRTILDWTAVASPEATLLDTPVRLTLEVVAILSPPEYIDINRIDYNVIREVAKFFFGVDLEQSC